MKNSRTYQFLGGIIPAFRFIFFVSAKPFQKRMSLQSGAQMVANDTDFVREIYLDYYKNA